MDTFSDLPSTSLSLLDSEPYEPTSTIHYVNSQLVSHGFARSPGLSLDGLANDDSEKLVKCLLGMLSQRIEDLKRTEELGSRLRTLTYEHERLQSMHQTAVDASANAEREMHQFKSKLAISQKSLAAETTAHKQTVLELQRSRTSLQYLRSTTQNELKRKDKDVERVMERWNKVADAQAKLVVTQSGLRCANHASAIAEPARGTGLMEQALVQAEEARGELVKENDAFRTVLLGAANALQSAVYNVRNVSSESHVDEPTPFSHPALFAPPTSMLSHPENAHTKLRELFAALRNAISNVSTIEPARSAETENEVKKLNELVASLRTELENSRQSSTAVATQSQAVLDRFTTYASNRLVSGRDPTPEEAAEMSLELIGVPERDAMRQKLNARAKELKEERARFTEAAVKLGKEKAALEAERAKILEEKRRWAVDQMLAELPPTPGPDPDIVSPQKPIDLKPQEKTTSSQGVRLRKASGSRSSLKSPLKKSAASKRAQGKVPLEKVESRGGKRLKERRKSGLFGTLDVRYDPESVSGSRPTEGDTEMKRSTTPEDSPPITAPSSLAAEMKTSLPLVLPTTFTLPPPSPASSFTAIDLGPVPSQSSTSQQQGPSAVPMFNAIPLASASAPAIQAALPRSRTFPSPRTPRFPTNSGLKHAYSPARPSPLSRILMLADSPPSPLSVPSIPEEQEDDSPVGDALPKQMFSQGLGLPVDEPNPLRESTDGHLNGGIEAKGKDEKRFTAKEKGKGRAVSDKENVTRGDSKTKVSAASVMKSKPKTAGPQAKKSTGLRANAKPPLIARNIAVSKTASAGPSTQTSAGIAGAPLKPGGARRVPIGGANALGVRRA